MWSTFGGVSVGVRDLARAEAAWASLLGMAPSWRAATTGRGCASSGFVVSNALLELRAPVGEGGDARRLREWMEACGPGLCAIALATDDLAGCARELRGRGMELDDAQPGDGGGAPFASALRLPESATRGIPVLVVDSASLPRRAGPAPGASVDALDHVVVASRDPDASRAVWGETLALRLALDRRFEARGLRILFFRLAGVTLEVAAGMDAAGAAGAPSTDGAASGLDALVGAAWRVGDVRAARERVAAAGFDVSEVRAGHKPGTLVCTVRSGVGGVATLLIGPLRA
jgi:catechol 2,3-dioxygenase-like lactoylglutathione lyase family enzyme